MRSRRDMQVPSLSPTCVVFPRIPCARDAISLDSYGWPPMLSSRDVEVDHAMRDTIIDQIIHILNPYT